MSQILEEILDTYFEVAFIVAEGFNGAVIGVDDYDMRLVYSTDKCISILMDEQGWDYLDAAEHFYTHIANKYKGKRQPLFINDNF